MKRDLLYAGLFVCLFSFSWAQTPAQRLEIVKKNNTEELRKLKKQFDEEQQQRESRINKYLLDNPKQLRKFVNELGVEKEIYDVDEDGTVYFFSTANAGAALTVRSTLLYQGGSLGLNVQGQNMRVGVWDGGPVRNTHNEFPNDKVELGDSGSFSSHGTHVMGTILAQGIQSNLRGIAFDASGISYNWNNDYSEMTLEAMGGLLVSNHSYWIGANTNRWMYGAYDNRARAFDDIAFNAPHYLAVTAAGNDRRSFSDPVIGPYLAEKFGFNLVRGMQNAKNFLTVGAVQQVSNYTSPSSVVMSDFSSWGPSDDGRIKPEVVAKGVNVRSTLETSDTANGLESGTSMASPAVAGVALLLQQHYHNVFNNHMLAATLKGLIIHTADEAGFEEGPDYQFGYGLVNTANAARLITAKSTNKAVIDELRLQNNAAPFTKTIYSSGTQPLMVSISWTDRPGAANSGNDDPTGLNIVNDLDVRVTKDTDVFYPWTLDPAEPFNPAERDKDNFRDNYEKVQVDNPSGLYTITVSHKGNLVGGAQNYSLIVSGPGIDLATNNFNIEDAISIYPNPANNVLNFVNKDIVAIHTVSLVDVTGKVINSKFDLNAKTIDVSALQAGVYFVKFESDNGAVVKRFVKK